MTALIECVCDARFPPRLLIAREGAAQHRCPECRRYWECCPSCFTWVAPFGPDPFGYCPECGLEGTVKSALRCGRRTLRDLREDPAIKQFQPLDGSAPAHGIDYTEDGEVSV